MSIILLLIHFYSVCYPAMKEWNLSVELVDRTIFNLTHNLSFLSRVNKHKLTALFLLAVSLIGGK